MWLEFALFLISTYREFCVIVITLVVAVIIAFLTLPKDPQPRPEAVES